LQLSPAAAVLNYSQAAFEGLRVVATANHELALFRIEDNARRLRQSASRLVMPPVPVSQFVTAIEDLVRAESRWVPPPEHGCLYVRPVLMGSGSVLGVGPASQYTFYIFVSPVGRYRPGPGRMIVLDSNHRAASCGTGDLKISANYAGTMRPHEVARKAQCKDVLYLDARHDRYVEELGSSNVFMVLGDGTLATPRLGSILPGITRDSVIRIARELLGWKVVEREIDIAEFLSHSTEAFFTGTAAGVQPIWRVNYRGEDHPIGGRPVTNEEAPGPRTHLIKERLERIQIGAEPDPFGWVRLVRP
jgi:branched-chain amino acid aminotransferase